MSKLYSFLEMLDVLRKAPSGTIAESVEKTRTFIRMEDGIKNFKMDQSAEEARVIVELELFDYSFRIGRNEDIYPRHIGTKVEIPEDLENLDFDKLFPEEPEPQPRQETKSENEWDKTNPPFNPDAIWDKSSPFIKFNIDKDKE